MGRKSSLTIFNELQMNPGRYMTKQCSQLNRKRLFSGKRKSSEVVKKRRKELRGMKKVKQDNQETTEGITYDPGEFV